MAKHSAWTAPVKIGHGIYKIIVEPDLTDEKGQKKWGAFEYGKQTISINREIVDTPEVLKEVLLHEIMHGIVAHYGANWNDEDTNKVTEERAVTVFALGLVQVMQDNPKLSKWLSEKK